MCLDPEGILWIRNFVRALASWGRTVFVSSHLMSEMALTADHLIVIGRGRLLADTSTADFINQNSASHVRVRSPDATRLADLLRCAGRQVAQVDGFLEICAATTDEVGDVVAANGLTVYELFTQRSSLEEAFMEMTKDSVEYHAETLGLAAPGDTEALSAPRISAAAPAERPARTRQTEAPR